MNCPVCGQVDSGYWKGLIIGLAMGALVGFIGGHLFYHFQIRPFYSEKIVKLKESNAELRKGYSPPKSPSLKKGD